MIFRAWARDVVFFQHFVYRTSERFILQTFSNGLSNGIEEEVRLEEMMKFEDFGIFIPQNIVAAVAETVSNCFRS